MDKLLELCFRSIVRKVNNDHRTANIYKNQAMQLHKKIEFEESCRYPIEHVVPEKTKIKLYELKDRDLKLVKRIELQDKTNGRVYK